VTWHTQPRMSTYTHVQFIGYAIPTIPQSIRDIGDPNSPGFVEGRYIGIEPPAADIGARIDLTMNAVEQTMKSGAVDASPTTLKIFLMPEFAFRGKNGAYSDSATVDYFTMFRTKFASRVADAAYEGWLFVFGTVLNTLGDYRRGESPDLDRKARVREDLAIALANAWVYAEGEQDTLLSTFLTNTLGLYTQYCHSDPVYEVADRSYVVGGGSRDADYPEGLSIEKKFISNEDFVLNLYKNAFSEEACAFPPICENNGENKQEPFDALSIFTIKGIKFGVEVCLDHYKARLRCNRTPDTEVVQIHLIPSCGMQITQPSIVACSGGLVFNCDGQYGDLDPTSTPNASDSIWTTTASNRSHTQLAQVASPCSTNNPSANMAVLTRPAATVTTVAIEDPNAGKLYAYGAGEVHVYTSLPVPPPVN